MTEESHEVSEREQFYDAEVAPALLKAAEAWEDRP